MSRFISIPILNNAPSLCLSFRISKKKTVYQISNLRVCIFPLSRCPVQIDMSQGQFQQPDLHHIQCMQLNRRTEETLCKQEESALSHLGVSFHCFRNIQVNFTKNTRKKLISDNWPLLLFLKMFSAVQFMTVIKGNFDESF